MAGFQQAANVQPVFFITGRQIGRQTTHLDLAGQRAISVAMRCLIFIGIGLSLEQANARAP